MLNYFAVATATVVVTNRTIHIILDILMYVIITGLLIIRMIRDNIGF